MTFPSRSTSLHLALALFCIVVASFDHPVHAFSGYEKSKRYSWITFEKQNPRISVVCFEEVEDSWENISASNDGNITSTSSSTGGYRSIEEWHEESHNPNHVIEHLKREQARWAKTFEDLGGDGI